MTPRILFAAATSAVLLLATPASAIFVDLLPSGDQWIRNINGDTAFTSDAMSVRGDAGDTRWSLLQFDLSSTGFTGADLISASLTLNARSSSSDAGQVASLIDINAGTQPIDSVTWNQYQIDHAGSEMPLSTLGNVPPATALSGGAMMTTDADAADLATIASTLDGATDSLLTLVLAPASESTSIDWTDGPGQLDNQPSVLRLEFPGTKPPCFTCNVELADAVWLRTGQALHNDGVLVTNNPEIVGDAPTVGLMEWDLSEITTPPEKLIGAELVFSVAEGSRSMEPGQTAGLIDTTAGTAIANIAGTAEYASEYGGTEQLLTGLGVVPDTTEALAAGDTFTTTATEADLDLIRAVLNDSDLLTMAMFGSDLADPDGVTGQYWGDGMGFGSAPQLVLHFVPEPSSVVLMGILLAGGMLVARRGV